MKVCTAKYNFECRFGCRRGDNGKVSLNGTWSAGIPLGLNVQCSILVTIMWCRASVLCGLVLVISSYMHKWLRKLRLQFKCSHQGNPLAWREILLATRSKSVSWPIYHWSIRDVCESMHREELTTGASVMFAYVFAMEALGQEKSIGLKRP